jgi:hypothetical protein
MKKLAPMMKMPPADAPMPMPALAPVERLVGPWATAADDV